MLAVVHTASQFCLSVMKMTYRTQTALAQIERMWYIMYLTVTISENSKPESSCKMCAQANEQDCYLDTCHVISLVPLKHYLVIVIEFQKISKAKFGKKF